MSARIYGEETEYGGAFISRDQLASRLSDQYIDYLLAQTSLDCGFLKNGALLYRDSGHIEYATPECLSPIDVVIYSKAGEHILNSIAKENTRAVEERTNNAINGRVRFFRHNVDRRADRGSAFDLINCHTFGCHENYSFDPDRLLWDSVMLDEDPKEPNAVEKTGRALRTLYNHLLPFLITRPIWTGSGNLAVENDRYVFELSQRIPYLTELSTENTLIDRGVFNWRDEPHAQSVGRLHLICGDTNMSEYQTYLKFGVTGLIIGMIEDHYCFEHLRFSDPLHVLQDINRTMNFHDKYEIEWGQSASPLDIQREYLKAAQAWAAAKHDSDITDIIQLWEETLTMLDENDPALARRLDWAAKRQLIDKKAAMPYVQPYELDQINLQYHDIDPIKSLYYLLVDDEEMDTFITREDIESALQNPPEGSRAQTRKAILNYFGELQRAGIPICYKEIRWDEIKYHFTIDNKEYERTIELPTPYETSIKSIGEISTYILSILGENLRANKQ